MDSVFEELYSKYHQDVFQFLIYTVRSRQLAEDLVQEVYIRVLKSHKNFEGKSTEKTWLFSIAKNVAIDHFRKQKGWKGRLLEKFDWNQPLRATDDIPEEVAMQKQEIRDLYKCIEKCTTDQRMVITMRYIQDLSISETAEVLEWTESKVKTTQHRAIKALKSMMEQQKREEGAFNEEKQFGRDRN
ncbi:RNA polymerase sigma factor SigX [Bacillus salacetis]|uniref:RNA polymerase sigma factor n=1 Tax=Bacillus salacetis TaxID=2315464 RepID=A0A3A1QM99_9BACI|nr:RNA polymerase sigma factor SigX [Bacillus salacetis]RIW27993.1 RNA polymerase sigma factor SigX [Bacillus salacetis]